MAGSSHRGPHAEGIYQAFFSLVMKWKGMQGIQLLHGKERRMVSWALSSQACLFSGKYIKGLIFPAWELFQMWERRHIGCHGMAIQEAELLRSLVAGVYSY